MHHTQDWTLGSYTGDHADNCNLALFADASLADVVTDSKSTRGVLLAIIGPPNMLPFDVDVQKHNEV